MIRRAVIALVLGAAPRVHAQPIDEAPPGPAAVAPADLPPTDPGPAPAPLPATTGTDPLARFPAGLDPATLCPVGVAACDPLDLDRVLDRAPPGGGRPITPLASAYAAGFAYQDHGSRLRGVEVQARADVTAARASGRLAYTLDQITLTDLSASAFHDLLAGATARLPTGRPAWLGIDGHLLLGGTMGDGAALAIDGGATVGGLDLDLGLGSVWLDGDQATTLTGRATRTAPWWRAWAELRVNRAAIGGDATTRWSGGAGVTLAPDRAVSLTLEALLGDRALTVLELGQSVEPVPDVQHSGGRALVWLKLADRARLYLGASRRTASTDAMSTYVLTSAFAGMTLSF